MSTKSIRQLLAKAASSSFVSLLPGLLIVALFAVGCTTDQSQLTPPPDSQLVAEVDLSTQSYEEEILGEFTLAETAVVKIFYSIPNIDTSYFDLSLKGTDGGNIVILHSEDFRTDEDGGGTWEQRLPPDVYRLMLTTAQTPGTLSVYWTSE